MFYHDTKPRILTPLQFAAVNAEGGSDEFSCIKF